MRILAFIVLSIFSILKVAAQTDSEEVRESFTGNPFLFKSSKFPLPDSLGGKNIKGNLVISLNVDSSGVIRSYIPMFFMISDEKKINIEYRYGCKKDFEIMERYKDWLDHYVKEIKLVKNPNFPKEFIQTFGKREYKIFYPIRINE